ncbi:alpha/beta fold hydrolase [Acinetobacter sp. ANC 4216]|uniref:alpha/beta fold hydrolase n=1 Tax=Acinetobacter sp. ANC 4216 TaxID=2529840 RepID=UPI00148EBEB5|nr:alpha/beta fold hydrolase [Acinetobacter sp. ANC 4216]
MMKIKDLVLKLTVSCLCLGSTYAIASPELSNNSKIQISNLPAKTPGTLLSIQAQNTNLFPNASQRFLITYRSRGIQSEPIVASGFILLPKGKAPKEGWPILAWAHGTTGVADTCAPSSDYVGGPVHIYQQIAAKALNAWLARGYAVVAPDYQGLGTPSGHPYMNAQSQLHTVVDAVRTTHHLKPYKFNKNWYVMGHSQGGAASLAVAAYGQKDAPELNLRGAIALAPGGYQYEGIAEYVATHSQIDTSVAAFFPIVLLGAEAADPSLVPANLVSPEMGEILNQARSRCLSELQSDLKQAPKTVFKPNVNLTPLTNYLKKQSIENMIPTVPVMVVQGEKDQLVDSRGTYAYYQQICKMGKPIAFYPLKEGDHRDSLRQSEFLIGNFINSIENKKSLSTCSAK